MIQLADTQQTIRNDDKIRGNATSVDASFARLTTDNCTAFLKLSCLGYFDKAQVGDVMCVFQKTYTTRRSQDCTL